MTQTQLGLKEALAKADPKSIYGFFLLFCGNHADTIFFNPNTILWSQEVLIEAFVATEEKRPRGITVVFKDMTSVCGCGCVITERSFVANFCQKITIVLPLQTARLPFLE